MQNKKIKIIRESNLADFENRINKHLNKGWKISGSIIISDCIHYQRMKKLHH